MKYTSSFQKMITFIARLPLTRSVISNVPRFSLATGRACSTSTDGTEQNTKPPQRFPGFDQVFMSPHIRQIRLACRLKIYQTGFVVCFLPTSLALLQQGYFMPSHVGYVTAFSFFSLLVLGGLGEFFRKFVGIIYLSEDKSQVIISHNTFWGMRKDVLMNTSDIIPLADTPEDARNELVWKIYLFNESSRNYYICTRYGGIKDYRKFTEIFGEDFEMEK